jgi:hypothetical protein
MRQQKATTENTGHHNQMGTLKSGPNSPSAAVVEVPENGTTTLRKWLDCTVQPFSVFTASRLDERKSVQHDLFEGRLPVKCNVQPCDKWKSLKRYTGFTGKNGGTGAL